MSSTSESAAGDSTAGTVETGEEQSGQNQMGLWLLVAITIFWGVNWPAIKLSVD
ncbi:MAG: hypothetical protein JNL25_12615, partial [Rhodospirillaceae bacterium]|nr:hypothetical protein [Rhodospirillaceae bacterium]